MTEQDLIEIRDAMKEAVSLVEVQSRHLREACAAIERCFKRLGYSESDIRDLLSDDFFDWWKHEPGAQIVQQQRYEAAMSEKRGKALRKHWPAHLAPLQDAKTPQKI